MMLCCGGEHPPDSPTSYVDFNGRRYRPPFRCLCCGMGICGRQFAFGRTCGYCDRGRCQLGLVIGRDRRPGQLVYETGHGRLDIREIAEEIPA